MSVLRVPCDLPAEGRAELRGEAARYLLRARRAAVGDRFVAFDPARGVEADAVLAAATRDAAVLEVGPLRSGTALPGRQATLIQAIGKGDKLDAVVRDATELGATRVVAATTTRSVPRRDGDAMRARLVRVAVEAARQCGRSDVPRIEGPLPLVDAAAAVPADLRVALLPDATTRFAEALAALGPTTSVAFVVGPEGGFDAGEVDALRAAGFVGATLGPLVLRTETVCAAVLGALLARS